MEYKVVRNIDDKLYSVAVKNPELRLEYPPNEWVTSKIGGILVFDNFICAENFAEHTYLELLGSKVEVWLCEVQEPIPLPAFRLTVVTNTNEVQELWNSNLEPPELITRKFSIHLLDYWPGGTKCYRKIRLVEKVYDTAEYRLTHRLHNF